MTCETCGKDPVREAAKAECAAELKRLYRRALMFLCNNDKERLKAVLSYVINELPEPETGTYTTPNPEAARPYAKEQNQ